MPANGKRFELPQLTPVNFSLTEGTDIPPPPDSPIEEKPQPPLPTARKPVPAATTPAPTFSTTIAPNDGSTPPPPRANGESIGRGRTGSNDAPPGSPVSSTKRPSSIRRFLSRKSLNQSYTDSNKSTENLSVPRPESPSSFLSGRPGGSKRNSSWFKRFSAAPPQEHNVVIRKPITRGPPPPKLPALNELKARIPENDEGSLGGEDIFKNIR